MRPRMQRDVARGPCRPIARPHGATRRVATSVGGWQVVDHVDSSAPARLRHGPLGDGLVLFGSRGQRDPLPGAAHSGPEGTRLWLCATVEATVWGRRAGGTPTAPVPPSRSSKCMRVASRGNRTSPPAGRSDTANRRAKPPEGRSGRRTRCPLGGHDLARPLAARPGARRSRTAPFEAPRPGRGVDAVEGVDCVRRAGPSDGRAPGSLSTSPGAAHSPGSRRMDASPSRSHRWQVAPGSRKVRRWPLSRPVC
jgi:hypothetical protein